MSRYRRHIIIGLIILGCVGIGEFWLYAAHQLGGYVHQPAFGGASLADLCETSEIGGFPFRLKLSCKNLAAPVSAGESVFYAGVEEANGVASLFSPNHIVLTFSSPLVIRTKGGAPFAKLRHDGMTLDLAWGLSGVSKARLDVKSLDWRPEAAEAGVAVNVQSLAASIEPQSGPEGATLNYDVDAQGVVAPVLQALLKSNEPGHFVATGKIAPPPAGADWRAALEDWRKRSGVLGIEKLEWRSGELSLRLDGALALDDSHRPIGRLNFAAQGAGPVLASLGIPAGAAQAGNILGALFGRGPAPQGAANTVTLALTLADGKVLIGPFRLPAVLQPLY
jgi:hypothetical protein